MKYNASSPDELALINFAKYMEYEYHGMDIDNNISLRVKGEQIEGKYRLLHVLEFNSTRKRQSVVIEVKTAEKVEIWILTKGADSVIEKRLAQH